MCSDVVEVRAVLSALTNKVRTCKMDLSGQEVGNDIHGLQGMSSDVAELHDMLSALVMKVKLYLLIPRFPFLRKKILDTLF